MDWWCRGEMSSVAFGGFARVSSRLGRSVDRGSRGTDREIARWTEIERVTWMETGE